MEAEEPLERGLLMVPLAAHGIAKIAKKKPAQQKYCMLFKASKQGIERLEVYESEEAAETAGSSCQRIITLESCIKISSGGGGGGGAITIVCKGETHELGAASEADAQRWARALQSVAFGDDAARPSALDKENDLYCFTGEGVFAVRLCPSEASERCRLEPQEYKLAMTSTAIELRGADGRRLYATWPYRFVRRYGYRRGRFTFEAGRKCETGEGTFHLEHPNQHELFRCLSMKLQFMKKLIKSHDSAHSAPALDWGDQFHPASLMDPRSRSPLPPSARSDDFEYVQNSTASSDQSPAAPVPPKPGVKPKPAKPPRKNVFATAKEKFESEFAADRLECGKYKKLDNYDSVGDSKSYDRVEIRNEAWKTLGINDIDHSEFSREAPKPTTRSQDNLDSSGTAATDGPKIIYLQTPCGDPDEADYDRLQHFGSTSKLNKADGYRKVFALPAASNVPNNNNDAAASKGTWSDYDEVETEMQGIRLADDSYLGYGVLRKPSVPGPQVPIKSKPSDEPSPYNDIEHCAFNETSYAIVSKPKQV